MEMDRNRDVFRSHRHIPTLLLYFEINSGLSVGSTGSSCRRHKTSCRR